MTAAPPGNRSLLVTIVAILFAAYYAFALVSVVAVLVMQASVVERFDYADDSYTIRIVGVAVVAFAFYLFQLIVSVKLAQRREWARKAFIALRVLTIVLSICGAVFVIAGSFAMGGGVGMAELGIIAILGLVILGWMCVCAGLIYLFTRPKICAEFTPAAAEA